MLLLKQIFYSFPIQLFLLHLKKHHLILIIWLILFGLVLNFMMQKYGVSSLFLDPEYLGKVNIWSFFLVGLAFGGFFMSWNITSYILCSFRFPFLATLKYPFYKFTINNSIIPLGFVIVYVFRVFYFQTIGEYQFGIDVVLYLLGFALGFFSLIAIAFTYFINTNKDILQVIQSSD